MFVFGGPSQRFGYSTIEHYQIALHTPEVFPDVFRVTSHAGRVYGRRCDVWEAFAEVRVHVRILSGAFGVSYFIGFITKTNVGSWGFRLGF